MNFDQAMGQVRPLLSIVGSLLIAVGLAKLFGVDVMMSHSWWEIGLAGFLMKNI